MKKTILGFFLIFCAFFALVAQGKAGFLPTPSLDRIENIAQSASPGDQWVATFGGSTNTIFSAVAQTDDGSLMVAGNTNSGSSDSTELWVIRLNLDGSIIWQKSYGGERYDRAAFVGQTNDGGFFVAGETHSFSPNETADIWVLKLASDGEILWQKTFGNATTNEQYPHVVITANGELLVASSNDTGQPIFFRIGTDGTLAWEMSYAYTNSIPTFIQEMENGELLAGGRDWIIRLETNGNLIWQKTFEEAGNPNLLGIHDIRATSDGGFIMTGGEAFGCCSSFWVAKLTSDGSLVWKKTFNYSNYDSAWGIQQTSDNGYIIWGHGAVNGDWGEAFILKLDENGNVLWQNLYDNSPDISVRALQLEDVTELATGELFAVGDVVDELGNSEAWGLKLDQDGQVASCSIIRSQTPAVGTIDLQFNTSLTTTITSTLSISDTFISPQTTVITPTYLCGGTQQVTIENIFTATGLPDVILVSQTNQSTSLLLSPEYTLDGGNTWEAAANHAYSQSLIGISPRNDPLVPVRLLSAYPGANTAHSLYRSGDWGQTWANEFTDSSYYAFAISPKNSERMYWSFVWTDPCGPPFCDPPLYLELYQSTDGSVNWNMIYTSTGYAYIENIVPSLVNETDGFFAIRHIVFGEGLTWVRFGTTDQLTFPVDLIALDATDANRIYGVTSDFSSGQTSPDGGLTWNPWASS
ncbi:MAG TPA: hypothetical protein PK530_19490, partial [Anaerolineales bacterium]|nr:hypothetical protein [Anaerolineales bacterium]